MKILFQGDSITDAGRSRENDMSVGGGYPLLIKASLGFQQQGKYEFLNRAISGNRIVDVYARIKKDITNIKPDIMSILVGVNDVWHEIDREDGVHADKYFKIYDMLIQEVKAAIPNTKIMIMEPFVLKGSATEKNWEYFNFEVRKRASIAKKISEVYNLPFVELQKGFDELTKNIETSYWLVDGVHPSVMGHEYIKNRWIETFKTLENR